ncbi:DUF1315 family protein [Marinospirillum sp.]|uniref:YeaC family protein n=1 Tax=Marinospirillum sp. TaxID=2183934 RepID=UPI0028704380|nr:DUF1315 family protein [Marinospirillum sp.]MDR9466652.1 DUF1315 family protein [Marinospirillum sp.]
MTFAEMIEKMTPDIYQALKTGVELGKWPNGQPLTPEQREISMEAVLRYEATAGVPEEERVGYIAPKLKKKTEAVEAVKILDSGQ